MRLTKIWFMIPLLMVFVLLGFTDVQAALSVQCPDDTDGDGIPPTDLYGNVLDPDDTDDPNVQCLHLTGGDGWIKMADGREIYIFSFSDVTDIPESQVLTKGVFRANSPAPTIRVREGDELYLTLTNVGTFQRPDLFDPHTVHYHGFPNASAIFDGLPESAIAINPQASLTYYYNNVEPGTYMYHCHVEATEHMQMGMLGSLYVEPAQNGTPLGSCDGGNPCTQFAYNDGDGISGYDVEYPIQLQAVDHVFHDASRDTQPLPFASMSDTYPTMNGRGYPDTLVAGDLLPPAPNSCAGDTAFCEQPSSQPVSSLITAGQGQKILLRISNLGVVQHYTITVLGIPMTVVGRGARLLRGIDGVSDVVYETNVVNLGGGESSDVILDTAGVEPGTYFLYATNLNYLSNNEEDYGGYMTEIVVTAPAAGGAPVNDVVPATLDLGNQAVPSLSENNATTSTSSTGSGPSVTDPVMTDPIVADPVVAPQTGSMQQVQEQNVNNTSTTTDPVVTPEPANSKKDRSFQRTTRGEDRNNSHRKVRRSTHVKDSDEER